MRYDIEGIAAGIRRVKIEYPRVTCTFVVGPDDDVDLTPAARAELAAVDVPVVVEPDRMDGRAEVRWSTSHGRPPGHEHTVYA